ncbi:MULTISPECIES: hypothetical protein [unclassified Neorhizobium]|uniref:hypothetical protein n=1 Tax=unclassified Neorhizobium TaxID=2629175 RepID=UPI001FF5F1E5|nr:MULTISPECIES: hypothetical protein [unclassified Neorhizobium]MCJ9669037.1 hypothetical protein [Neorhizobium sp. SHOUNA12B]MCJ9744991.1 hypothetical protein [Neorhizobium sp. SHOUNA12A]
MPGSDDDRHDAIPGSATPWSAGSSSTSPQDARSVSPATSIDSEPVKPDPHDWSPDDLSFIDYFERIHDIKNAVRTTTPEAPVGLPSNPIRRLGAAAPEIMAPSAASPEWQPEAGGLEESDASKMPRMGWFSTKPLRLINPPTGVSKAAAEMAKPKAVARADSGGELSNSGNVRKRKLEHELPVDAKRLDIASTAKPKLQIDTKTFEDRVLTNFERLIDGKPLINYSRPDRPRDRGDGRD